ncbi:MAG: hypothetical protein CVU39_04335 [Chloroflexi bacterium HGW-Chloroflexi-10]|nr:MAG: hypothetical protein CVU39_04335 [Chloroflexi bacterium HGW-Chloroflexi-10]
MQRFSENTLLTRFISPFYQLLISFLFSQVFTGQILGILNVYKKPLVLIFVPIITVIIFFLWRKFHTQSFWESALHKDESIFPGYFKMGSYLAGLLLLTLIIVPIVNWPNNTLVDGLEWDAGEYHFPKAVELYTTGSVWDFSISYGDYPFGYESLLSFDLLLTNNESLFSLTHALIAIFFILSVWFLAMRYSRLPKGLLFLLVIFLMLSGFIERFNPWFFLRYVIYTIGKNDLFLAAATIAAIFFSSIGRKEEKNINWFGLGITTALSISIKPNSGLVLLCLWILAFAGEYSRFKQPAQFLKRIALPMLLGSSGALWIVRNFIGLGQLFNPESYRITEWSIASNITFSNFYHVIPNTLKFSLIVLALSVVFALFQFRSQHWQKSLLFATAILSFVITPASTDPANPSMVAWRFGIIVLIYQFVLLIAFFDPILNRVYAWVTKFKPFVALSMIGLLLGSVLFFNWLRDLLRFVPENSSILVRSYEVADYPYQSVFDYANENISHSVVWVEGGQTYYAYDDLFTNSVTRSQSADYLIVLNEERRDEPINQTVWAPVYSDSVGTVFKRK